VLIKILQMVLRTLGRYALKLRNDNEFDGAGHFLGLDDGKFYGNLLAQLWVQVANQYHPVFNFFAVVRFIPEVSTGPTTHDIDVVGFLRPSHSSTYWYVLCPNVACLPVCLFAHWQSDSYWARYGNSCNASYLASWYRWARWLQLCSFTCPLSRNAYLQIIN